MANRRWSCLLFPGREAVLREAQGRGEETSCSQGITPTLPNARWTGAMATGGTLTPELSGVTGAR